MITYLKKIKSKMNIIKKLFTKKQIVNPLQIYTYILNGVKQVGIDVRNIEDLHAILYFFNAIAKDIQSTLKEHPDCSVRISAESWEKGGQLKLEHFKEMTR